MLLISNSRNHSEGPSHTKKSSIYSLNSTEEHEAAGENKDVLLHQIQREPTAYQLQDYK